MATLSLNTPLLRFSLHRPCSLPSRLFSSLTFSNALHFSPLRCIATDTAVAATPVVDPAAELPELEGAEEDKEQEVEKVVLPKFPVPKLTVKEKKDLASYAHSLGKKLKYQQVGKSGVTPAVAASFVQTLEANELLKLKIHGNCPEDFQNAIRQLEESTGSVAVGQIGRSVILYRPSLSKMKKEESQDVASSARKTRSFKRRSTKDYKSAKPTSYNSSKPGNTFKVGSSSSSRNPRAYSSRKPSV